MSIYDNERWVAIEGFEGLYEISDHGRARSLDRPAKPGRGNYAKKGKILSQSMGGGGYLAVTLYKDGKKTTHKIHRLVAKAFCKGYCFFHDFQRIKGDVCFVHPLSESVKVSAFDGQGIYLFLNG